MPSPHADGQARNPFLDRVIAASGLPSLMAGPAVIRACQRAQVDPSELDSSALRRVLPYLEMTLQLYLPEEAGLRLRALDALANEARGSRAR